MIESVHEYNSCISLVMGESNCSAVLNPSFVGEALGVITRCEQDEHVRFVLLRSAGPGFCQGIDLSGDDVAQWVENAYLASVLLTRIASSPLVVIALVEGDAVGGGVGLAAACDLVVAGPQARFRLTEAALGLIPAVALPMMSRRTGMRAAYQMALTGENVSAIEAQRVGLVDEYADDPKQACRIKLSHIGVASAFSTNAVKRYRNDLDPVPEWTPHTDRVLRSALDQVDLRRVRVRLQAAARGGAR